MQMCRRNNTSKIWDRFPGVGDWQLLCDHCFDCLLLRCTWAIEVLRHMSLQVNFTPSSPGTRSRLDLRILMRSSLAGVLLFYQVWSRSSPVLLSYPTQWCLVALTTMNHLVILPPLLCPMGSYHIMICVDNPGIDKDKCRIWLSTYRLYSDTRR